jgi:hypothetical protein
MVQSLQVSTGPSGETASFTNTLMTLSEVGISPKMTKVKLNGTQLMTDLTTTYAMMRTMITTMYVTRMNLWINKKKKKTMEAGGQEVMMKKMKTLKTKHGMSAMMLPQMPPTLATEMPTWSKLKLLA